MARTSRSLALLATLGLLVAACGDDDDAGGTSDGLRSTEPAGDSATTDAETGGGEAGDAQVEVADTDLGEVLVSDGMTLYVFTPDDAGPSTCYDDCAAAWPPLLANGEVAVAEPLDDTLFSTAPRDDGGDQVTVAGWPLYFFASDTAPGDVNGQGVGGNWWVVGPDGEPIQDG